MGVGLNFSFNSCSLFCLSEINKGFGGSGYELFSKLNFSFK